MKALIALAGLTIFHFSAAQETTEAIGNWSVKSTVNSFTDEKRGIALTTPTTNGAVVVKCDKPGPRSLYFSVISMSYLGADGIRPNSASGLNKYRIDDNPPAQLPMAHYDGRSANLFDDEAYALLRVLADKNPRRLRLQLITYDSQIVNADFDVSGVAEVIKRTAAICGDTRFG